jgi:chromosome segregation ATPase
MHRTHHSFVHAGIAVVASGLVGLGCAPSPTTPSSVETTSAPVSTREGELSAELANVQRERGDLQQELADQRLANEDQAKTLGSEMKAKSERAELARYATTTIDAATIELKALENRRARAPAKSRARLDKAVAEVRDKLAIAETGARKIGMDHGAAWTSIKGEVEGSIAALQQAVQRESSGEPGGAPDKP